MVFNAAHCLNLDSDTGRLRFWYRSMNSSSQTPHTKLLLETSKTIVNQSSGHDSVPELALVVVGITEEGDIFAFSEAKGFVFCHQH
jgi:hypothetical protein